MMININLSTVMLSNRSLALYKNIQSSIQLHISEVGTFSVEYHDTRLQSLIYHVQEN